MQRPFLRQPNLDFIPTYDFSELGPKVKMIQRTMRAGLRARTSEPDRRDLTEGSHPLLWRWYLLHCCTRGYNIGHGLCSLRFSGGLLQTPHVSDEGLLGAHTHTTAHHRSLHCTLLNCWCYCIFSEGAAVAISWFHF